MQILTVLPLLNKLNCNVIELQLVSKFNVILKHLLHQGLSEGEFYGNLVYNG